MSNVNIGLELIHPEAKIPTYSHEGDAGADLYSVEYAVILPGDYQIIPTGIKISMDSYYVGLVHPRSGLAAKHGVTVLNAPGTIDSGYRGEIKVILVNHGSEPFRINVGDRIAQIVFQEYAKATFLSFIADSKSRQENGFGSTGGFNGAL